QLRAAGVAVQMHASADPAQGMGSFKSQFKKADASGAACALVFGADELARGEVALKPLRGGEQQGVPLADVGALAARIQSLVSP
ncbi:MAG: His/Gly/Thr/Pro-type tRNA ligase C-terminal domain-containing protein, partial [Comamonadaceae bacterium]|nr:His/Gly/Thr/Pro-type tRNA ligase C-terminal domain-containing protein [Comamonadaceae bacterium]